VSSALSSTIILFIQFVDMYIPHLYSTLYYVVIISFSFFLVDC
jgi:hypothetical protein